MSAKDDQKTITDVDLAVVIAESGALTVKENGTQSFDMDKLLDHLIENEKETELEALLERLGIKDLYDEAA